MSFATPIAATRLLSQTRKARARLRTTRYRGTDTATMVYDQLPINDVFHRISDDTTRVTLQLDHDPQGFLEKAGDALGIVQHRIKGDLKNFKSFIEARGAEEDGWRGDVDAAPQSGGTV